MYKKVAFRIKEGDKEYQIVKTVLMEGYSYGVISEEMDTDTEELVLSFMVYKCDLKDLRHDLGVLQKAGFNVREIEAS